MDIHRISETQGNVNRSLTPERYAYDKKNNEKFECTN